MGYKYGINNTNKLRAISIYELKVFRKNQKPKKLVLCPPINEIWRYNMPDFLLSSTELREPYNPRECFVIRRLRSEIRNDIALVKINPLLEKTVYNTKDDIEYLLLASKHAGYSLFPVTESPTYVYICTAKEPINPESDFISSSNIVILDWGKIVKE